MQHIFRLLLSLPLLFLLQGCSFSDESDTPSAPLYIEKEGTLIDENTDSFALAQYALLNAENQKVAVLESSHYALKKYVGQKVILKGKKMNTQGDDNTVLSLDVIQIKALPSESQIASSDALGVSISLPPEFFAEEKDGRFHILKTETEDQFFTFFWQKNADWQKKFQTQGEKIIIQDFDVRRLYAGKRIQLYFPKSEIQIDYWGEKNGEYDFYSLLDQISFHDKTPTPEITLPEEEKKDTLENIPPQAQSSAEIPRNTNTDAQIIINQIEEILLSPAQEEVYTIHKIALYKNFADVELSFAHTDTLRQKKRIVYDIVADENQKISLQETARFREGEIQSWEIESGNIPTLAGESEIFLRDIEDVQPIVLPEHYALYVSTHFDFQVGYPRKMYYGASGKSDTSLASVNWSTSPLTPENAEIRLEILAGSVSEEKIIEDENTIIFPRDEKTHFKFSALHDNFNTVQNMKKYFRNEQ